MPAASPVAHGTSQDRRGVFLRVPADVYRKLQRLMGAQMAKGKKTTMQAIVIDLIAKAREAK